MSRSEDKESLKDPIAVLTSNEKADLRWQKVYKAILSLSHDIRMCTRVTNQNDLHEFY